MSARAEQLLTEHVLGFMGTCVTAKGELGCEWKPRRDIVRSGGFGAQHRHHLADLLGEGVAADERARIVWWLRAGVSGPAGVNEDPAVLATIAEMAEAIEQHPERFAGAPTGRSS